MRKPLILLPLVVAAAGCQTYGRPYVPVEHVAYSAIGENPFWLLAIGDDRIVLRIGGEGSDADNPGEEAVWARTLPRTVDGLTTWTSGEGTQVISIEARAGPCTGSGDRRYEDHVTVRLSGRELGGCGGRVLGLRD